MSALPDRRPRIFSLSKGERLAAIGLSPGANESADLRTPSYEAMSEEGRARVVDYYETEIEWFQWEYLSERRSTRTSLGVDIVQQIAENIVNFYLSILSLNADKIRSEG